VKRREFITLLGGAAAVLPIGARAQQAMPVVGFLNGGSPGAFEHFVIAFRQGLGEAGYVEHRNVGIDYRWAEGQVDRLPALARELVRAQVAVICAGGPPTALAAKAATTTIPIVFTSGEDPVKLGLVASYNKPGGNVTGVALLVDVLGAKRLGLLREVVPAATLIAVLLNPTWPTFDTQLNDVQEAARAVGQQIHVLRANTEREIDAAFDTAKEVRAGAMMVGPSTFFTRQARPDRWTRGTRCTADDLRPARIYGCRRPDELCDQSGRCLSPGRRLQRQNFGRRETGRTAGGAISQVRAADQSQDR
jgi:putative tryptophan/tyrosine transport system substrate-binding protein